MDLRRLRVGEWIVGAAGVVLLISLFLPWYGSAQSVSGWEAFAALDVILALVALAAISVPLVTAAYRVPAVPLAWQSLTVLIAFVALLLVLLRVLNLPGELDGRESGLWLGLVATLGICAGGLVAMRDERRAPSGRAIEKLPAPRPEGGT
jgi:hypothetical protein